jgi:hypothetical protein
MFERKNYCDKRPATYGGSRINKNSLWEEKAKHSQEAEWIRREERDK